MSAPFQPREGERGAALLTVLLLVAITGVIAASAFDRLRLSSSLAANFAATERARGLATGVESLLLLTIDDMLARGGARTTLAGGWNGASRRIPVAGGVANARVRDGGNCLNLNSVVQSPDGMATAARPAGIAQFAGLMTALDVREVPAQRIAAAAADWADSDDVPLPGGAEDNIYLAGERPHRTANTLFAEASELRAVAGMTAEIYARVRPFICALPVAELSPLNVNTLSVEQAPLLAMLAPRQLSLETARRVIAARPMAGWANMSEFWRIEALSEIDVPLDVQLQPQLRTQWFAFEIDVNMGGAELKETALVDARLQPGRIVVRRFGADE